MQADEQKIESMRVRRQLAKHFVDGRRVCSLAQEKHTDREDQRCCRKASHVGIVFRAA